MRRRLAGVGEAGGLLDLELLQKLGTRLDARPKRLDGKTIRQFLVEKLLQVRTKQGEIKPLVLNRAQEEYEGRCGKKNIVLKARQLGITTYVAARFFVHTITRRGTLSVQVAHNQDSAEEIFRIVHRFLENLPERLRAGALCTSRANVRQSSVSAARQRVPRGDSGGPERRPRDDHPELALFGGRPLARRCGGDTGGIAGGGAARRRDRAGIDSQRAPSERSTPNGSGQGRPVMCSTSFPGGGSPATGCPRWRRLAS